MSHNHNHKKIEDPTKEAPTRYWDINRVIRPTFPVAFGGQRQHGPRYLSRNQHQHQHQQQKDKPIQVDSINEFPSLLGDTVLKKERISTDTNTNISGSDSLLERLKASIVKEEEKNYLRRCREALEEEERLKNGYKPVETSIWSKLIESRNQERMKETYAEIDDYDVPPDSPTRRYSFHEDNDMYNDI